MVAYFYEVGPTLFGDMGEMPISHVELLAWQENSGVELSSWEARAIVQLSREYLSFSRRAQDPKCEAPWDYETEAKRVVAHDLKDYISGLAKL